MLESLICTRFVGKLPLVVLLNVDASALTRKVGSKVNTLVYCPAVILAV